MRKTKKAIASLAIAGMVLSMAPMSVFGATDSNRLGGAGRVETAIAIAAEGWTSADSVIVVPADDANTVDALAAAPLAGQLNAPILLTYKDALDPKVQQKIVDLGAKKVYAVGALKADTVASLKAISGVEVTLLQGADRTETAGKVAAQLTDVKGTFVVAYDGVADALSAASFAAANDYSIVIANPDKTIPASEKVVGTVYTVGGQAKYDGATPLYGADRYATNNAVINGLTYNFGKVYVANGQNPVDALAGAPLAAQTNSPIVLGDAVGVATGANDNLTADSKVIALGGTGAVSESVLAKVAYQAPAELAVENVSVVNGVQLAVKFTQAVDKIQAEDESNYSISPSVGFIAKLNADTNTVTLTLDGDDAVANDDSETFAVTVEPIAAKDDSSVLTDRYSKTVVVKDQTSPSITKVESITNDDAADYVEITFSEPVNGGSVRVDGTPEGSAQTPLTSDAYPTSKKLKITGLNLDAEESHTLQIYNLEDYSGNIVDSVTKDFDVTIDDVAPVVTSVTATGDSEIKVVFSEEVKAVGDTDELDGTIELFQENNAVVENYTVGELNSDHDTLTITIEDDLYTSKDSREITLIFNDIEDVAGNAIKDDTKKSVELSEDEDAPSLKNLTFKKDADGNVTDIVATFSENVTGAADFFPVVINPDGVEEETFFTSVDYDDDEVTYTLTDEDELSGKYTLRFAKGTVTDKSAAKNPLPLTVKTIDFGSGDDADAVYADTYPQVSNGIENVDGVNVNTIEVKFGTPVGVTATYGENYTLNGYSLTDAYIKLSTDKTVATIVVEEGTFGTTIGAIDAKLTIRNVKDSDGDLLPRETVDFTGDDITDDKRPELVSAQVVGDTIILTYNEAVNGTGVDETNFASVFEVKVGSTILANADFTDVVATKIDTAGKKVQLTLTPADGSDWNTKKTITVKTKASTVVDAASNVQKSDITVTASK